MVGQTRNLKSLFWTFVIIRVAASCRNKEKTLCCLMWMKAAVDHQLSSGMLLTNHSRVCPVTSLITNQSFGFNQLYSLNYYLFICTWRTNTKRFDPVWPCCAANHTLPFVFFFFCCIMWWSCCKHPLPCFLLLRPRDGQWAAPVSEEGRRGRG